MRTVVVTFLGSTKRFVFPADCLIGIVLREVAMGFNVTLPPHRLALADEMGNPLSITMTLEQELVVEGEPLELLTIPGG